MSIIDVENLVFKYSENVSEDSVKRDSAFSPAINGVSLCVEAGEFLAIVGHNGSGKSTLAKHFNGLLLPNQGQVKVHGMSTHDEEHIFDIRRCVGMVFQNPDNQIVNTIVEDDVAFGPENLGLPPEEIRRRVDAALDAVGMTEYKNGAPHMLSGGQKQRVAIAGMLAMQPEVLVLDEATAMLDPLGRKEILSIVTRLNKEQHMTVIMITQYMEEAVCADRVIVMNHGKIEFSGTPRQVFSQSTRLRFVGLDVPVAVEVRNSLISAGMRPTNAITVDEVCDAIAEHFARKGCVQCP